MKLFTYGSLIAVFAALSLSGCAATSSSSSSSNSGTSSANEVNTNPVNGWVVFDSGYGEGSSGTWVAKKCDGTTLVYVSDGVKSGGVSTIINSPECTR